MSFLIRRYAESKYTKPAYENFNNITHTPGATVEQVQNAATKIDIAENISKLSQAIFNIPISSAILYGIFYKNYFSDKFIHGFSLIGLNLPPFASNVFSSFIIAGNVFVLISEMYGALSACRQIDRQVASL